MENKHDSRLENAGSTVKKTVVEPSSCCEHRNETIVTLVGGDERQRAVSASLAKVGFRVHAMGLGSGEGMRPGDSTLPRGIRLYYRISGALEGCAAVVLPYPASRDGVTIPCPMEEGMTVSWDSVLAALRGRTDVTVFGGRIPAAWVESLQKEGIRVVDYEENEAFLQKNAYLTAEAAVMTAMELTDKAILHSKIAILGYGRIGKELAELLGAWGAEVTVVARRPESRAEAEERGLDTLDVTEKIHLCTGYDVIFNTVPARLLDRETLLAMPCNTLIVELASSPGGLDPEGVREAALRCGLQIIRAPGLPGRYAPEDAGRAIAECILELWQPTSAQREDGEVKV